MSSSGDKAFPITLDQNGRVILGDQELEQIAEQADWETAGGFDGQVNDTSCVNTASCGHSINVACTNSRGACGGASNTRRCDPPPPR